MKLLETPEGFDPIEVRKQMNAMLRQAQADSKPTSCILCGKSATSFCNSHSVPQMVLKSIAENGKVLQSNLLVGVEMLDVEKGVNNSGTFHYICNDCDSKYFQDYENPVNLKNMPTDRMMAEIALKDSLIQLSKRMQEIEIFKNAKKAAIFKNTQVFDAVKSFDINEYMEEVKFYKNIIDNDIQNGFQILFWKILPYKVPIAVETGLALAEDMNGHLINDLFCYDESIRMQIMHICIFPIETETVVLAFYHKRDKKYQTLRNQFNSTSIDKVIKYLNWLVIKYTENYFISKNIQSIIENNQKLQELSQENAGFPNMGMIDTLSLLFGYNSVGVDEIPNFLDSSFAV